MSEVNNLNLSEDSSIESERVIKDNSIKDLYMLVVTTPDSDINRIDSYMLDSWTEAYGKMVELIISISKDELESDLLNGRAVINTYSAQSYSNSIRYLYHIIPYFIG